MVTSIPQNVNVDSKTKEAEEASALGITQQESMLLKHMTDVIDEEAMKEGTKKGKPLKQRIKEKQKALLKALNSPKWINVSEKLSFCIGVFLTIFTSLILGRFPMAFPYWYIILAILLLGARFVIYHKQHSHYFMLDFCYFSNFVLIFYLLFYPTSSYLFLLCWANNNGPVLFAIVAWRNSLVFHDFDKLTSVFIHAFPVLLTYVVRWFPEMQSAYVVCPNASCSASILDFEFAHIGIYLFWQLCYFLKTEVVDSKVLQDRPELVTSFRYLSGDTKHPIYKILITKRPEYRLFIFMGLQLAYSVVTVLPVKFMFDYFWFHTAVLMYVFGCAVWNGANFFFSKAYLRKLQMFMAEVEQERHHQ